MAINLDPKLTNITWFGGDSRVIDTTNISADAKTIKDYLTLLNTKMDQAVRDYDYWDAYKFELSVDKAEDLGQAIMALNPNHSLVINVDQATYNNTIYNRGDILLKKENGDLIHVPGRSNGIFYVESASGAGDNTGLCNLTYAYANTADQIIAATAEASGSYLQYTEADGIIRSNAIQLAMSGSGQSYFIHRLIKNGGTNHTVLTCGGSDAIVQPVIKAFMADGEELITSFRASIVNNDHWEVVLDASLMNAASVDASILTNSFWIMK